MLDLRGECLCEYGFCARAMADESDNQPKSGNDPLDLNSLSSLSLGPDWSSGEKRQSRQPAGRRDEKRPQRERRGEQREGGQGRSGPRDRRGGGAPRQRSVPRQPRPEQPFEPVVEADFYPEEEPFKVLTKAIRNSCRTYELFEIARLILDKPDRFVCVVRDPKQKEGEEPLLYASVPDGLPFRTEEAALDHVFRWHLGEFFDTEEVEAEPPAGHFPVVHKCGVTGEIIGPPNYHRYQGLLKEHHSAKVARMPFDKMVERLETSREEEDIQKWKDSMKRQTRYKVKGGETVLENPEDARLYLLTHSKEQLVRPAYSARFSGRLLDRLPRGDSIRRSVEAHLEYQRKFPLKTANHLRGRLRRMKFAVYKRGSKGVSYVCAVKRRFRKPDEVLADNLQELIDFLEAHPNFPAKDLPKSFLGIREPGPAAASGAAEAGNAVPEPASEEGADTAVREPAPEASAREEASEEASEEADEAKEAVAGTTGEQAGAEAAESGSGETTPEEPSGTASAGPVLGEEEKAALGQLRNDLRYLVSEGYVIEYSDGRLFVPPVRQEEINRQKKEQAETGKPDNPEHNQVAGEGESAVTAQTDQPAGEPEEEANAGTTSEPETPAEATADPEREKPPAESESLQTGDQPEPARETEAAAEADSSPEETDGTTGESEEKF